MRTSHSSRITGESASLKISSLWVFAILASGLTLWQLAVWQPNSDLGYYFSSPILVFESFIEQFAINLTYGTETLKRGIIGLTLAFVLAYPLGVAAYMLGYVRTIILFFVVGLLGIPRIVPIYWSLMVFEPTTAVNVISYGTPFLFMFVFGYQRAHQIDNAPEYKDIIEQSMIDGCGKFSLYWHMILPLTRRDHLDKMYVMSTYVWSMITYAEAVTSAEVVGIGVIIDSKSESTSTYAWFYSASLVACILVVLGLGFVWLLDRVYTKFTRERYEMH